MAVLEQLGFSISMDAELQPGFRWIEMSLPGGQATLALVTTGPELPTGIDTGIRLATDDARCRARRGLQRRPRRRRAAGLARRATDVLVRGPRREPLLRERGLHDLSSRRRLPGRARDTGCTRSDPPSSTPSSTPGSPLSRGRGRHRPGQTGSRARQYRWQCVQPTTMPASGWSSVGEVVPPVRDAVGEEPGELRLRESFFVDVHRVRVVDPVGVVGQVGQALDGLQRGPRRLGPEQRIEVSAHLRRERPALLARGVVLVEVHDQGHEPREQQLAFTIGQVHGRRLPTCRGRARGAED